MPTRLLSVEHRKQEKEAIVVERNAPYNIVLEETSSEYLLYINASLRQRAKQIEGRTWDSRRKCWVYPRTLQIYRSIIAEFGDSLNDCTEAAKNSNQANGSTRPLPRVVESVDEALLPSMSVAQSTQSFQSIEIDTLTSTLSRLQQELNQAKQENVSLAQELLETKDEVEEYRDIIADLQKEGSLATQLRKKLAELEQQLGERRELAKRHTFEIQTLKSQLAESQLEIQKLKEAKPTSISNAVFTRAVFKVAQAAAEGDEQFAKIIENRQIDAQLPLLLNGELVTLLERKIPRRVGSTESLHDLLKTARESNLLTDEQLDLAHIIRKQRNVVAHVNIPPRSVKARSILTLFAAALLWPELPR